MQKLKNILSVFLLLVFLFPLAEKGIHDFSHINDKHCTSANKHFHPSEHHCEICDFTGTNSDTPTKTDYQLINSVPPFLFQLYSESIHTRNAFHHLPSRAPPVA